MQPTLITKPREGDEWLHEIKYDGYRTQLAIGAGQVRAFTRNGFDWTDRYAPIVDDALKLPCRAALIDGEVTVQDARGITDFGALRKAITSEPQRLVFFAFDLLHLDGTDLRPAALEERRAKLRWLLTGAPQRLHLSDEYDGDGRRFFELADQLGLEGIVSKRKGSRYVSGETESWVKVKCWTTATLDVVGVERDKVGVPYALLADADGYRGAAFITLPASMREIFWRYVEGQSADKPLVPVAGRKRATWLKPGLRATVRHLKGSDKLRHATVTSISARGEN